jgi:ketosteroid isomerase-like protein
MPLSSEETANLDAIRSLYAGIANGPNPALLESLCDPGVIQEEFPNRLLPHGIRRDLPAMREAAAKGRALMASQTFELLTSVAMGAHVAVEGLWTGTVGTDIGPFKAGMTLRTRFAQIFEFRNGKIVGIRNYDCFDPW